MSIKIEVEVEIYTGSGRSSVSVTIDEAALRELAEREVMSQYTCDSCAAKGIEFTCK